METVPKRYTFGTVQPVNGWIWRSWKGRQNVKYSDKTPHNTSLSLAPLLPGSKLNRTSVGYKNTGYTASLRT